MRETDANGVSQATYLAGLRGPEYRRDDVNGGIKWYIFDGLGSVLAEMDGSTGALTASRKLDVYGAPRATQGTPSSKHAFVGNLGHTTEPDTGGLVYMRARWMDPVTGRFLSEDPARDGANWFGYCGGDPVNAVDRDGRRHLRPHEQDHFWLGCLLAWEAFGFAACAAMSPPVASAIFQAAAVATFLASAYQSSLALGLNDGRGLMFGGAITGICGTLAGVVVPMIISVGKLASFGAAGAVCGGAVLSWQSGVIAAVWMCENLS